MSGNVRMLGKNIEVAIAVVEPKRGPCSALRRLPKLHLLVMEVVKEMAAIQGVIPAAKSPVVATENVAI